MLPLPRPLILTVVCLMATVTLSTACTRAQPSGAPEEVDEVASVQGVVPFAYIDHIYLDVTLNDTLAAVLLYDPVRGVLLDERYARQHGLARLGGAAAGYGGPVYVGGAGEAEHEVTFVQAMTMALPAPAWPDTLQRAFPLTPVIPLDSMMAVAIGRRVDGLFGIDILADQVLEFDFERERFVLHDPATFVPPAGATAVPLVWVGRSRKPAVGVTVHLPDGGQVDGQFLLDFGMGGVLRLTTGFTETHGLPARIVPNRPSGAESGLGGALQSLVGRVPAVTIGAVRIEQPVVSMAQEQTGADAYPAHDGLIGLGLLDRYRVFYDVPGEQLWLAATPRAARPYVYAPTGAGWEPIRLVPDAKLTVRAVSDGSAAERAGLRPGDQLLALNGRDAAGWTRRHWAEAVEDAVAEAVGAVQEPALLRLQVLRGGTPHEVILRVVPAL